MSCEVVCADCDRAMTFARDPAREVPCPRCFAPVGGPCKKPSGHAMFKGIVHNERDVAALEAFAYGTHRRDGLCTVTHSFAVDRARRTAHLPRIRRKKVAA